MQVSITARHFDLTEGLRAHTEEKLGRLGKYGVRLQEAHVVLVVEKHRHRAEVTLHGTGFRLTGMSESADMYSSVDQVAEKLEQQVRKQKGRMQSRKQRGPKEPGEPPEERGGEEEEEGDEGDEEEEEEA